MADYYGFMNSPKVFESRVVERMIWEAAGKKVRDQEINKIAKDMATKYDRSNPFAYAQTVAALKNGTATPEDYYRTYYKKK